MLAKTYYLTYLKVPLSQYKFCTDLDLYCQSYSQIWIVPKWKRCINFTQICIVFHFHLLFRPSIVLQKSYMRNWMNHWPSPKSSEINWPINGNHRIWIEAIVLIIWLIPCGKAYPPHPCWKHIHSTHPHAFPSSLQIRMVCNCTQN